MNNNPNRGGSRKEKKMNAITKATSVAVLVALSLALSIWAAEPPKPVSPPDGALPPYGHADFYPSPERPIGWRADGSGAFPGARPVTYWTEGKPVRVDTNPDGTKHTVTTLPTPVPVNILWKTVLRGWANNQPIVIGKRLITTAEPHWLICLDAETGQVLWERRNSPFELMGLPPDEVQALDEYLAMFYTARMIPATMLGNYCDLKVVRIQQDLEFWKRQLATSQQILERLVANNKYGANAKDALAKVKEALPLMDDPKANAPQIRGALRGFVWHLGTEWLQKRFCMWSIAHWDAWMGWTFATPVSDGQYIYASMGQGQAVCYDLQGNRRWGVFLPFDPKRAGRGCGCLHCSSPLLADNVLLVQGISDLFGLDARTGAVLWRATNARHSYNGFNEVGSHSVVRLPSGRAVVATTSGAVFDVKTGKQVADLGAVRSSNTGMVSTGNVIPLQTGPGGGAGGSSRLTGIRLDDGPNGTVVCTRLWDIAVRGGDPSPILHDGVYYSMVGGALADVATGTRRDDPGVAEWARVLVGNSSSPILAGDCLVGNDGGNAGVAAPYPHVVAKEMRVAQVVRPGFARLLSTGMFVSAGSHPRDERVETYNPEWAEKGWLNDSGMPAQFGNGSPSAHGDRLYFRTTAALICIGPSVKGTPADDPAQAIRIREATTPEAVLEFLGSKSDQYRYEACRTLGRLARSGVAAKDAQEKLAALVTKDRHPDVRAAAIEALDAGDPAAKRGQALLKACLLEMSGKTPAWERSDAGATLRALGEGYVVAALLPMITGDADRAAQTTATAILAVADVKDTRVRDALIANLRRQMAVEDSIRALKYLWPVDPVTVAGMQDVLTSGGGGPGRSALLQHLNTCLPAEEMGRIAFATARNLKREDRGRAEWVQVLAGRTPMDAQAADWVVAEAKAGARDCMDVLEGVAGREAAGAIFLDLLKHETSGVAAAGKLLATGKHADAVAAALPAFAAAAKGDAGYAVVEVAGRLAQAKGKYDAAVVAAMGTLLDAAVPAEAKRRAAGLLGGLGKAGAPALDALRRLAAGTDAGLVEAAKAAIVAIGG